MAVSAYVGELAVPGATGSQAYTDPGFQPVAVLFWTNGLARGNTGTSPSWMVGATDGTRSRAVGWSSANASTVGAVRVVQDALPICGQSVTTGGELRASLTSLDATGFTLNWTEINSYFTGGGVSYLALGGDVAQAYCGTVAARTTPGTTAVTDPGFTPDVVIFFLAPLVTTAVFVSAARTAGPMLGWAVNGGAQACLSAVSVHAADPTDTAQFLTASRALHPLLDVATVGFQASVQSFDANGFTLDFTAAAAAGYVINYLALRGGEWAAGNGASPLATGTQSLTTSGMTAKALLSAFSQITALDTVTAGQGVGMAGATATRQQAIWQTDTDAQATTQTDRACQDDAIYIGTDDLPGTVRARADVSALGAGAVTLNWPTVDAGNAFVYTWLAVGDVAVAGSGKPALYYTQQRSR